MHFEFDRAEDMLRILRQVADERGYELVLVDDVYEPSKHKGVTSAVEHQMGTSDGFIQIIAFRDDELGQLKQGRKPRFNNAWLHHEYGLGKGKA